MLTRRLAYVVPGILLCMGVAAQQQVLIISEKDTTQPQAVHILDSLQEMEAKVSDPVYSGHLFSTVTHNGDYWVAFSTLDDTTARLSQTSRNQPDQLASKAWNGGLEVTDVAFGDDHWLIYARANSGVEQVAIFTGEFNKLPELIEQYWADGFVVTEACHGNRSWGLVFSRPKTNTDHPLAGMNQVYSTLQGDFEKLQGKVESRWEQGYAITTIATNGNAWLVIGSQTTDIISQRIVLSESKKDLAEIMYSVRQQQLAVTECVGFTQQ